MDKLQLEDSRVKDVWRECKEGENVFVQFHTKMFPAMITEIGDEVNDQQIIVRYYKYPSAVNPSFELENQCYLVAPDDVLFHLKKPELVLRKGSKTRGVTLFLELIPNLELNDSMKEAVREHLAQKS